MNKETSQFIEKIKGWREVVKTQNDYFIKFAIEYFVFNALLRIHFFPDKLAVRDRDLIDKLKQNDKCRDLLMNSHKRFIMELIEELQQKPLVNLTRNKELVISNSEDWDNIIEAVYWIRNNLFHGYKYPGDERDKKLVRLGYHLISGINDCLFQTVRG
jgi:hypothetical protein